MINSGHSYENNIQIQLPGKIMYAINDEIFGDFSFIVPVKPSTDIKLSSKELLEVSQNISRYYAPKISHTADKLIVLPVDPQHVFVYWNLGDELANFIANRKPGNELNLRIYSQPEQNQKIIKTKVLHDFTIYHSRSSKTIKLATTSTAMNYSASIGTKGQKKGFIPLLACNNIPAFKGAMTLDDIELNNVVPDTITKDFSSYIFINKKQQNAALDEDAQNLEVEYLNSVSVKPHFAATNCSGLGYNRQTQ